MERGTESPSEPPAGRVQRVPYKEAVDLVGEKAIASVGSEHTRRHDWQERGVPPERLCGLLIRAVYAGRLALARHDSETIERVREIARRTGEKGDAWRYLAKSIDMTWRDLRRAGPR